MKKNHLIAAMLLLTTAFVANAQIVEKGTKLIDVYYGWPNLWTSVAKSSLTDANSYQIKVGSIGPIGGRLEFMTSERVGLGVEVNYSNTSVSWKADAQDGNGNNVVYDYKVSVPRVRAMFAFNFHFGGSEEFDAYWKLAAGYSSLSFTYSTNDPNYNDDRINFNVIPVAIRTAVGGRYFITENFHLNAELGLGGGPLMAFGVGTRF